MHAVTTRLRRRAANEGGNVLLAVLIISVASIAVLGTLTTVTAGLELSRTDQSRANAFQLASGGVDQALYRIDQNDLPILQSASYVPTVVAGRVTAFTENLTIDASAYQVSATQDPPGQTSTWRVNAVGTDPSGRQRQAVATIEAERVFEEGFFTERDFYLVGNQDAPVAYDSRLYPDASVGLGLPVPGRIGTNATFQGNSISHFRDRWAGFNMYGRATQAAADTACGNGACGTAPTVRAFTDQKVVDTPDVPAGVLPCPGGGNITGAIAPGDYTCANVNLQGTVTVSGTGNVRLWVSGTFSASSDSVVNWRQRSLRFQVFQDESVASSGGICGAELWGLFYTPGLVIDCNGSHQPTIYGAVLADIHSGNGNHFDFHWDVSSTNEVNRGSFSVRNWRECPVSLTDC